MRAAISPRVSELPSQAACEVQPVSLEGVEHSRVVIVDDNVPSLQLVQSLLSRAGLQPVQAITDPVVLLESVDELAPDLILLDLHMPGVDGYTVLTELRKRAAPSELPVLVLTADVTREATHRALQLGANDFLTKPLDAGELILRVRNLLLMRELHAGLQRRHRWLDASGQLARDLLSGNCDEPLRRVCELASAAADADGAAVVVSGGFANPDSLTAQGWVGDETATGPAAIEEAFASGFVSADSAQRLASLRPAPEDGTSGPAMLVPLFGGNRLLGTLVLCRTAGHPSFTENELMLAEAFGHQAAMAVEFAQARNDQERRLLMDDRHRIARDLHDQVIQRLFATGLRLQQLASRMEPGPFATRIDEHVDDLDATITEIRSTIFGLRQMANAAAQVPERLRSLVGELTDVLGFEPQVHIKEPLDAVPGNVAEDLLAAVREVLTNVAKHACATCAEVSVSLTDDELVLDVLDDGVGIGSAQRRSGLTNLYERARLHGGSCTVSSAAGGGTHVLWTVPLSSA